MKILLADCGSSKCDWALVDTDKNEVCISLQTKGLNLAIASEDAIEEFATQLPEWMVADKVEFYGAGATINGSNDSLLNRVLANKLGASHVDIDTDLIGAAKALFNHESGVACILGTGSNSGLYDGRRIIANTPPLGFILGDEGSGAALGKRLVNAVYKGLLPADLTVAFFTRYNINKQQLIQRVYREPGANFFLAGFTHYLAANIDNPIISKMVRDEFLQFISHNLLQYFTTQPAEESHSGESLPNLPELTISRLGFVGSIAYHFSKQLKEAMAEGLPSVTSLEFLPSPIDGLIRNYIN